MTKLASLYRTLAIVNWTKDMSLFEKTVISNGLSILILHLSIISLVKFLNPKAAGGRQLDPPPSPQCGFSKNISSKGRVKPWFILTFNIIISHIFPEIFIEIPQVVQKIWRISLSILAIFIDFHQFFGFSDISLLQKN